jgi:phosphoribosylamine-glycine ligase
VKAVENLLWQQNFRMTQEFLKCFCQRKCYYRCNRKNVHLSEIKELRDFAIKEKIDLTIVGPEAPLVAGLKDEFKKHDLKVFGPNQKVASLEGSKAFLRNLCRPMISKQQKQ